MFFLLAALVSSPSFAAEFPLGSNVDLNQAFYVCSAEPEANTLNRLLNVKDIQKRRQLAREQGCVFRISANEGPLYRVERMISNVCLDPQRAGNDVLCGREGHMLVVSRGTTERVVIQLSLDIDYD